LKKDEKTCGEKLKSFTGEVGAVSTEYVETAPINIKKVLKWDM
tara:strand:+ start:737 stop:865 length:129 start_codon:yes stop_codon:yes gene_type:complete